MLETFMIPGIPETDKNVSTTALKFINDVIYATFYSEKLSAEYRAAARSLLPEKTGFQPKYLGIGVSPDDIEVNFRSSINELLEGPYADSAITGAVLTRELIEETSQGRIVHWKIVLESSGAPLITGLLAGAVLYSIE